MTAVPTTGAVKHGYSSYQIAIHWTVVALVATNVLLGDGMSQVFHERQEGEVTGTLGPAYAHVTVGVTLLLVMVARALARWQRPVAVAPGTKHPLMRTLAKINHISFYAMLFLIPILGAVAWFGGSEAAGDLHGLAVTVLLVLIALHVGGALLHVLLGENEIRRMVRPTGGT